MDTATEQSAPSAVRAPRLTDNRLDDLAEVVRFLSESIEDQAESEEYWAKAEPRSASVIQLYERIKLRRARLVRGREWLAGKIAAERGQRAETVAP